MATLRPVGPISTNCALMRSALVCMLLALRAIFCDPPLKRRTFSSNWATVRAPGMSAEIASGARL